MLRTRAFAAFLAAVPLALFAAPSASAHAAFYFTVQLEGAQVVPPSGSTATGGGCLVYVHEGGTDYEIHYHLSFQGLSAAQTAATVHGYAPSGSNAGVLQTLPLGTHIEGHFKGSQADLAQWLTNSTYLSIASEAFPGGEIRGQIVATSTPAPQIFCTGEGAAPCPCGNQAAAQSLAGCRHSLGYGATLRAQGVASLECDLLELHASALPTTTSVLFFQGSSRVAGGVGTPFGDGLRCVEGSVLRLGIRMTTVGDTHLPEHGDTPLSVLGAVPGPGHVSHYQAWYRNVAPAYCTPAPFNLTNGLSVTWAP